MRRLRPDRRRRALTGIPAGVIAAAMARARHGGHVLDQSRGLLGNSADRGRGLLTHPRATPSRSFTGHTSSSGTNRTRRVALRTTAPVTTHRRKTPVSYTHLTLPTKRI